MGADSEFDADGQPTAGADGDDLNRNDDEDGVAPISVTKGAAPSIDVNVTNTTAGPATLAGWVDLDKSGTFDANERATATVPAGTNNGTVTLTFAGVVTTTQATYARFRLFPGVVADPLPTGAATGRRGRGLHRHHAEPGAVRHQDVRRDGEQQARRRRALHGQAHQHRRRRLHRGQPGADVRRPDRRPGRRDLQRATPRPTSARRRPTPRRGSRGPAPLAAGQTVDRDLLGDAEGRR